MGRGGWRRTEGCRPSHSPPYKGAGSGLGRPSQPIQLIKVTAGEAVDRPPCPIEGARVSTRARTSSRILRACHPPCTVHVAYVAQGAGVIGRLERRFPGVESK